jgi:hypothetical protein
MATTPEKLASMALAGAALAAVLCAAGCVMQPTYDVAITTAEGDVVDVPMTPSPIDVSDGVVRVDLFQYAPTTLTDGTNRLQIRCQAEFSCGARPTAIVVRDVTDAPIITLFDVRKPDLVAGNRWIGATPNLGPSDDAIRWVANIDNSIRIYRFAFTLADGSVHVLTVPVIVPAVLKDLIRKRFGT